MTSFIPRLLDLDSEKSRKERATYISTKEDKGNVIHSEYFSHRAFALDLMCHGLTQPLIVHQHFPVSYKTMPSMQLPLPIGKL